MINRLSPTPDVRDHGGGLDAAMARHGGRAQDWLDLSTGINPRPYPFSAPPAQAWARLPDAALGDRLETAARAAYGAPNAAGYCAAAGAQALIQALPWLRAPSDVAILGPAYAEHARCWRLAGHRVVEADSLNAFPQRCDVAVAVTPNNPDGRVLSLAKAEALAALADWLVLDESFADATPEHALTPHLSGRMIALRSFGKFYGLAGARLGIAFGPREIMADLARLIGPWGVSGPALVIGAQALADRRWASATRRWLCERAGAVDAAITAAARLTALGGTPLFRLLGVPDAAALRAHLCARRILARAFFGRGAWLRLGLPATRQDLDRLADALASFHP